MDDLGLPPFLETSKNNSFFCLRMGHTKFFQEQKVVFQSPELAMIYGLCMICLAFGGTRILNSLHGQPIINLQISKVSIPPISKFGMVYGFGTWKIGEVSLFPQPVGERAGWIGIGVFSVGGPLLLYLILRRKKLLGSQGQPGAARGSQVRLARLPGAHWISCFMSFKHKCFFWGCNIFCNTFTYIEASSLLGLKCRNGGRLSWLSIFHFLAPRSDAHVPWYAEALLRTKKGSMKLQDLGIR